MNRLSAMLSPRHSLSARTPSPNPAHQQQQQQQQQHHHHHHRPSYSSGHNQAPYQQQQQHHSSPPPPTYGGHAVASGGGAGGFQPQRRMAPPPGADPTLWSWFSAVDADGSGSISAVELQQALVNGNWTAFDLDTVKMLMSIFDTDRSGTIGFNEFAGLWKYIADWQNVFRHFDRDHSGSIDQGELGSALTSFGYHLSQRTMQLISDKYSSLPPTGGYGPPPGITFDRFVRACVVVKTLTESFQALDTDRDGIVAMSYDQFMRVALGAP